MTIPHIHPHATSDESQSPLSDDLYDVGDASTSSACALLEASSRSAFRQSHVASPSPRVDWGPRLGVWFNYQLKSAGRPEPEPMAASRKHLIPPPIDSIPASTLETKKFPNDLSAHRFHAGCATAENCAKLKKH
jgi:hypothetical protein